jgi:hypothetical protein
MSNNEFVTLQGDAVPVAVEVTAAEIIVTLSDGRRISNPLDWFPWLEKATPQQRQDVTLHAYSVEWEALDNGLDVEGMLRGIRPRVLQTD